jgi:hypothetical protein
MATDARTGQPIFGGSTGVGLGHVGSYQSAGTPWLSSSYLEASQNSGSIIMFEFPRVAKSITVQSIPNKMVVAANADDFTNNLVVFFGHPDDSSGTDKAGKDTFDLTGAIPGSNQAPMQYIHGHVQSLQYITGAVHYGEEVTFGVRSDHICLMNLGTGANMTSSYQVYAELTNIPAGRMADNYISGSGINIYP